MDEDLLSLIRDAHEFAVQTTCSVPESNPLCQKARDWLEKVKSLPLWPGVAAAIAADAKRQMAKKLRDYVYKTE